MMRLEEVCGGALQEKFQNSLNKVMENLQDENVPYNTKREILTPGPFAISQSFISP